MLDTLSFVLSEGFMQRAITGGIFISLCAALLGVSLVLKRYSMIGDGLSHVGFGTIALASALGWAPLAVTVPVVVIAAFLLLRLGENSSIKGDAAVAIVSTGSLAVGIIASSLTTGMNQDFNNYMFGNILGLGKTDVILSIAVSIPVLILFIVFYNKIFAVTFDESFAKATGVKAGFYNAVVAILTALIIVIGMRLMGALLISSLVIFPSLTAMRICKTFKSVVIASGIISVVCFLVGISASILIENMPTGASIVASNIVCFAIFSAIGKIRNR